MQTTILTEMTALAQRTGAVLGQGFPDEDGPAEILEAAVAALRAGHLDGKLTEGGRRCAAITEL